MNNDKLVLALDELDKYLTAKALKLEIVICGAFAIQLHGFMRGLFTQDIDTIRKIDSTELITAIAVVGTKLGLGSRWLNDQASTVSIPKGAFERARPIGKWNSILAFLIDRVDLIKMKASAFSIRREETIKDWEDLVLMNPTKEEIQSAIEFLKQTNSPPDGASRLIIQEFEETIDDLKRLIR